MKKGLATALKEEFAATYDMATEGADKRGYQFSPKEVGRRRLRNTVLDFLSADKDAAAVSRAKKQFDSADCMTDRMAALVSLSSMGESVTASIRIVSMILFQ